MKITGKKVGVAVGGVASMSTLVMLIFKVFLDLKIPNSFIGLGIISSIILLLVIPNIKETA